MNIRAIQNHLSSIVTYGHHTSYLRDRSNNTLIIEYDRDLYIWNKQNDNKVEKQ